jgi:hypothetical protein
MTQEELKRRAAEVGLLYDLSYMEGEWNPLAGAFGADDVRRFLLVSNMNAGNDQCINFFDTIDQIASYLVYLLHDEFCLRSIHDLESENYLTPLPIKIHVTVSGLPDEDEA